MTKAIFLDRDGVINEDSSQYIKSSQEWLPISNSLQAIANLNKAGVSVGVASNQSGLARGYFSLETLHEMHSKMQNLLLPLGGKIEHIFYCPHHPQDLCACRKPKTGLLDQIITKYSINISNVPFVGDSEKDLVAARAANCLPILVRTGKGEAFFKQNKEALIDTLVFKDLYEASQYLLDQHFIL